MQPTPHNETHSSCQAQLSLHAARSRTLRDRAGCRRCKEADTPPPTSHRARTRIRKGTPDTQRWQTQTRPAQARAAQPTDPDRSDATHRTEVRALSVAEGAGAAWCALAAAKHKHGQGDTNVTRWPQQQRQRQHAATRLTPSLPTCLLGTARTSTSWCCDASRTCRGASSRRGGPIQRETACPMHTPHTPPTPRRGSMSSAGTARTRRHPWGCTRQRRTACSPTR